VNVIDVIDVSRDLCGRQLKRWVARAFFCAMLLCPSVGIAALTWYGTHRGQQIQQEIERIIVPRLTAAPDSHP